MFRKHKFSKISKNHINFHKSKFSLRKFILCALVIVCIVLMGFLLIINNYLNKINKVTIDSSDVYSNENILSENISRASNEEGPVVHNSDIINIALFGIDETEGIAGRSDCIMILTIDNVHKKFKLSSIIRDSYVTIPTKNTKDKINHAYAFGGPQLALKTINENFKLNIDKFVAVNFTSLPKIIDSVGGVTLDITDDELTYINEYIDNINEKNNTSSPYILKSGNQLVDGTQALAYCRIRYTAGGDFERSQRHRTVIKQLFEKSKSIPMTQYTSLLDQVLPIIHTNLEKTEIISTVLNINSFKNYPLLQDRFPKDEDGDGKLIGGIYYYVFDEESTNKKIQNFIYEK